MQIKKHIPNAITCLNLFSGCIALVAAFEYNYILTAWLVFLAAIFDFLDGFAARMFKAYSAIGKELDSLADVISFGLVPSMVVFSLLRQVAPLQSMSPWLPYAAFLIVIFSALRLAVFNIDERQTTSFIGMPTPANALFWVSLAAFAQINQINYLYPGLLLVIVAVTSFLLVSNVPMFSLKFKSVSFKENFQPFTLLALGVVFVSFWGFLGISLTILVYILWSVMLNIIKR